MTEPPPTPDRHPDAVESAAPGGYLEPVRAAGAVLWRDTGRGREIALVHRPRYNDWTLPKGKLDEGEHVLVAAVRETVEETGVTPRLGRRLATQRYWKSGWPKQVDWWAATPAPGTTAQFTPTAEVDAVEWLPAAEARARLTYPSDVRVLDDFLHGPAQTVPLVLLRHASAGNKNEWHDYDLLRPLDEAGRAHARAVADILAVFGPLRVVSSTAARCLETVVPYAAAHGVEIRTEHTFTVGVLRSGAQAYDPQAARQTMRALVEERQPTLVCTHGELVADLMAEAAAQTGAPARSRWALRKGAFWVVHRDAKDGSLVAVEHHGLPG